MRCHLFIDEVGNGDLRGASSIDNERYLSLTGIITTLEAYERQFIPQVQSLKEQIFGPEIASRVIFHRREIMRREGVFAALRDEGQKSRFDDGMLKLFQDLPYLVHTVVIDKRDHMETYGVWHFDPYHYCLHILIERYVLWLRRHNYTGDVAAEPRNSGPDRRLKESYRGIYNNGTDHIPARTVQRYLTTKELKFTPKSANCPAMQMCDLLAYPSFKAIKREKLGEEPLQDFGQRVVTILEETKYGRNPNNGKIWGIGKKWLPK
jgi:hypothetical protein